MKVLAVLGSASARVLELAAALGEVVAVSVAQQATALQRAPAGVQRIHVWDDALAELAPGSDAEMAHAAVLAALARRLTTPLVVLCDSPRGLLGAATAEQLGLPLLSQVLGAEPIDDANLPLRVIRRCLHGVQQLRGPAAAVLSVVPGSEEPAEAASEPVTRWGLGELGLTPADLPRPLLRPVLTAPHASFPARRFATLEELVEQLRQDGLG
ncbi:MAG: hypothetical protein U1A78_09440 [Polyangia bacterium]